MEALSNLAANITVTFEDGTEAFLLLSNREAERVVEVIEAMLGRRFNINT